MGTKLEDGETKKQFTILNIYGPFYDRKLFSKKVVDSGALDLPNVIIGGDLNLTLSTNEIWGKNMRVDALGPFFSYIFEQKGLIDMAPTKLFPTRRNNRGGEQAVSKRLDRFLIA